MTDIIQSMNEYLLNMWCTHVWCSVVLHIVFTIFQAFIIIIIIFKKTCTKILLIINIFDSLSDKK